MLLHKHTKTITMQQENNNIEFPMMWSEKLETLSVNDSLPVDKRSTVDMAIYRNYPNAEKVFKIRKIKATGETRVWRIK